MFSDRLVFTQIIEHLSWSVFRQCVIANIRKQLQIEEGVHTILQILSLRAQTESYMLKNKGLTLSVS